MGVLVRGRGAGRGKREKAGSERCVGRLGVGGAGYPIPLE